MNQSTTYTPLESLFLFQLLAQYGLVAEAFPRISFELTQNNFIKQQESYDAERLSPEKLEHLACRLVREEQVREAAAVEKNGNGGGSLSPASRKRKLPSPALPSLKELQAQREKLPQLVDKLYAIYQADIIRRIREDEATLERLEREVQELEVPTVPGNVAARPQPPPIRTNGVSPSLETKAPQPMRPNGHVNPLPASTPASQVQSVGKPGTPGQPPIPQSTIERKPSQPPPSPVPSSVPPQGIVRQSTPGSRPSNLSRPPSAPPSGLQHPQAAPAYTHSPGPSTPQPPLQDGLQRPHVLPPKSQSPAPNQSPQLQQPQTPGTYKWEPPFNPQHPPYNGQPVARPAYPGQAQPGPPQHPYPQHSQVHYGNRQTPQPIAQPVRTPTPGNSQLSQAVLVPPQVPVQNAGQAPPRPPHPDGSVQQPQQYRHPVVSSSSPAPTAPISAPQYPHQQQQFHAAQPGARQTVAAPQAQITGRGYPVPPPTGHRPALAAPTPPGQPLTVQASHSLPSTPVAQRATQTYIQPPHLNPQAAAAARQLQRPSSQVNLNRPPAATVPPIHPPSQPQTPVSAGVATRVVRGHGTKWTSTPTPSTPKMEPSGYFDPQSPAFEPISPPIQPAQLPKTSPQQQGKKEARKNKPDPLVPKAQSRLSRSAHKPPQIKESAEDGGLVRKIKDEEATPKPFEDAGDTTADESVQGKASGTISRQGNKRKRQETPENRAPPTAPTHVLWTRSFHKVSQSALEQVTSHRHANMFAAPIKPRDAPGYPDIILRPQDLKQIRAAINHGQRAASALEKSLPDLDPNAMNVWLPISVDLIPPKGIINIAQLERELVHMFANSIMYNQDPDRGVGPSFVKQDLEDDDEENVGYEVDENGIVKETRNMFVEVEKLMSDLRSEIERNAQPPTVGRASVSRGVSVAGGDASNVEDDGDQTGDAEIPSTAKRRRKA